jgi:hypothetical protein
MKVSLEEKMHDLEMAKRNLSQVTQLLEEKSQSSESVQNERLQSMSGLLASPFTHVLELPILSPFFQPSTSFRLSPSQLKKEKDELKLTLESRERELVETRKEVSNVIEKKKRLENELERLRAHLVAVEDSYTQEAIESEERERELRKKLQV